MLLCVRGSVGREDGDGSEAPSRAERRARGGASVRIPMRIRNGGGCEERARSASDAADDDDVDDDGDLCGRGARPRSIVTDGEACGRIARSNCEVGLNRNVPSP